MNIDINKLQRGTIQLRVVLKNTLEYAMLKDSISDLGILTPLLVRPKEDYYEVVDGAHRYEVCTDLGITTIPCHVKEMSDEDVLRAQVVTHASRIETKPAEYARRLWKIINIDHSLTLNELATHLRWHPDRLKRILRLVNLSPRASRDLTRGDLHVTIAIELARLPLNKQDDLLDVVGDMTLRDSMELVRQEVRSFRDGGRGVMPIQRGTQLRPLKEVENEHLKPTVAASILSSLGARSPLEGWKACLLWVLKLDPASLAAKETQERIRREKESAILHARTAESLSRRNTHE